MEIIAIDGPGGVGKSTLMRRLAERLGYFALSSGLIYRCMAWHLLRSGWLTGASVPLERLGGFAMDIGRDGRPAVNGRPVEADLGAEAIGQAASVISAVPAVREIANAAQRETAARMGRDGGFSGMVIEGRDIGTVVFPDAAHKFFMLATPAERARRRWLELRERDPALTLETVRRSLAERDARDESREVAPLMPAADAVLLDTSALTIEQVLAAMLKAIGRE